MPSSENAFARLNSQKLSRQHQHGNHILALGYQAHTEVRVLESLVQTVSVWQKSASKGEVGLTGGGGVGLTEREFGKSKVPSFTTDRPG